MVDSPSPPRGWGRPDQFRTHTARVGPVQPHRTFFQFLACPVGDGILTVKSSLAQHGDPGGGGGAGWGNEERKRGELHVTGWSGKMGK